MSRPETMHAHAIYLRARAEVLKHGDDEAQQHACDIEAEADEIDHLLGLGAPDEREEAGS